MKKISTLLILVIIVLSFTLFACSTGSKDAPETTSAPENATEAAAITTEKPATTVETDFPVLPDAENIMDAQGTLIYQTATKMSDVFDFYKQELTAKGLTENEILTLNDPAVSQLVFTGSENGKSLIVQMTRLSDKSISVAIRYE